MICCPVETGESAPAPGTEIQDTLTDLSLSLSLSAGQLIIFISIVFQQHLIIIRLITLVLYYYLSRLLSDIINDLHYNKKLFCSSLLKLWNCRSSSAQQTFVKVLQFIEGSTIIYNEKLRLLQAKMRDCLKNCNSPDAIIDQSINYGKNQYFLFLLPVLTILYESARDKM